MKNARKQTKRISPSNRKASEPAQRAWGMMTTKQREQLRKTYKQDPDRDGVPTGYDCQPRNRKKQESFLPEDRKYVRSLKGIQVDHDRPIGQGTNGVIMPIKGNSRMVAKVGFVGAWNNTSQEMAFYNNHNMSKLPLISPQKSIKIGGDTVIVKPIVKPVVEPGEVVTDKSVFTTSKLKDLRTKIIKLSYMGYVFDDGLQLGIDKAGRLLQFDTGAMQHINSNASTINRKPFIENNRRWLHLLHNLGRKASEFGQIEQSPALDKAYLAKNRVIKTKLQSKSVTTSTPSSKSTKSSTVKPSGVTSKSPVKFPVKSKKSSPSKKKNVSSYNFNSSIHLTSLTVPKIRISNVVPKCARSVMKSSPQKKSSKKSKC